MQELLFHIYTLFSSKNDQLENILLITGKSVMFREESSL